MQYVSKTQNTNKKEKSLSSCTSTQNSNKNIAMFKLNSSIEEAFALKVEKEQIDTRLKELNEVIKSYAVFENDKKTAVIHCTAPFSVKVSARESIKWDNEKVFKLKEILGNEEFARIFKSEYKHHSKQVLDNFLAFAHKNFKKSVLDAFEIQTSYHVNIEECK